MRIWRLDTISKMPKKGKKGKGGKKGKKGGKKASKKDPTVKAMSEANSTLWQARLEFLESSRAEYRENSRHLADQNFALRAQMEKNEEDTIDVITLLTKKDEEKENQMEQVHNQMKELRIEHRKESEKIIDEFQQQIHELEQDREARKAEVERLQSELKKLKDFGKKRAQMHKELEEIKETMYAANREHKEVLLRMEQKFFEEKMRLQQEANQKIAELADRAHTEAITNLDETTRSVYKDNIRLNEALSLHMEEGVQLKRIKKKLMEENEELKGEKEVNEQMVQNKVLKSKMQTRLIKELQEKVEMLEKSLNQMVNEFEKERRELESKTRKESEAAIVEIEKLQRMAQLKTNEMNKVKKLARSILEERREIERFFLDALDHVKQEVAANRAQYRRDAHMAYQQKMLAAHVRKGEYPKIRTFIKSDASTNSVFRDLEAAETLQEREETKALWEKMASGGKVDISDLTWEQKEKVLRNLFAMINGAKERRHNTAPPAITGSAASNRFNQEHEAWQAMDNDQEEDKTFLTQAVVEHSLPIGLPDIHQSLSQPSLNEVIINS